MALDRDHLARDPAHHRRRIARAGADLEHPVAGRDLGRLDHQGDDIGLRDGLVRLDRQRRILIGVAGELRRHERLARHLAHRREQARIARCRGLRSGGGPSPRAGRRSLPCIR